MHNCLPFCLFFKLLLLIATSSHAEEWRKLDWQEKKNEDGIQIFTSKVSNSKYDAVYGSMLVKGSANSLVALVQDTASCPRWADLCKKSRVHKKISATEFYVYTYNDVPFPVSDRDVLAKINWYQDPNTQQIRMISKPVSGIVNKTNAVRIEEADSRWYFTPLKDGTTKVETYAHINPNGPIPGWLTNLLLVGSPFKTMKNMRSLIEEGAYANSSSIFKDSSK